MHFQMLSTGRLQTTEAERIYEKWPTHGCVTETMVKIIGTQTQSLFGTTPEDVKNAFSKIATNKQFGLLARDFFARLTNKCLNYFVSRAVHHHVGEGRRFRTLAQQG